MAKVVLCIAAVAAMPRGWAQESPYKDQGEYDIATAVQNEKDPQKKLDKLKEWEQKYPNSKLAASRTLMQAQALTGIALSGYGKTDPATLDASEKAAQQLVSNLDTYFAPGAKPAQVTDQQWTDAKHATELQVYSALGWDYMQKKDDAKAEETFKKILALSPDQAQVSYWLGSVILRQKNVARYSEALYDIARSVMVTTGNPLPAAAKQQTEDFLKKAYANYHGDDTGLDQVKTAAAAAALPPPDYHIKSVDEIQKEQFANEEEFNKAHPDIALWRTIRAALKAPDGASYFDKIKGSQVPPPDIGTFKAKIVSIGEKEIVANIDNAAGDATLKFEHTLNKKFIKEGDAFEFKGVVDSFTPDPYMLTLTIDDPKEMIKGIDDKAFEGAPAKKAPTRKKK